jgi:hypothetical protein
MMSNQNGNQSIGPGVILVETGTVLPESLRLEGDAAGNGWAQVVNNADTYQLEKNLAAAGWSFLFRAGTIRASAVGSESEGTIHAAVRRLFKMAKLQKYNCLEIDKVATKRFCGIPYVSVSAHSRNIQEGANFAGSQA